MHRQIHPRDLLDRFNSEYRASPLELTSQHILLNNLITPCPPSASLFHPVSTTESPSRYVVNPGTDGQQLFVASPSGADDQKLPNAWLISGDGVMRALSVKSGRFAQTTCKDQVAKCEGIAADEEIMPSCAFKYSPPALIKT
ncbi:hypothetical protein NLJ89_g8516 [Agrocybe chaxingu]|uniref:Uncharacterized protein n=1 Tax=Agrocybe chaxingu TaxID=84603 RepID=A0A9W8MSP2_9AGAR|nr:hypothetical protein NLJ89_g8516 [Agrocybe chaxingu]